MESRRRIGRASEPWHQQFCSRAMSTSEPESTAHTKPLALDTESVRVIAEPLVVQLSHTIIQWLNLNEVTSRIRCRSCGRRRHDGGLRC